MRIAIFTQKTWLLANIAFLLVLFFGPVDLMPVIAQDSTLPIVAIISPESTTYSTADVNLVFTLSENVSWIGYSLDGAENQTIDGNVTLSSLTEGTHSIIVYATDLNENTGASIAVNFGVSLIPDESDPPVIIILSPENKIYSISTFNFKFTIDEDVSWIGYSLDDAANVTINGNFTLWGLPNGPHSVVVYATDLAQNVGKSNIVNFSIDTIPPTIIMWPPANTTYPTSEVDVVLDLSADVIWIGYSLDGAENQTIDSSNFTLSSLSDGTHNIVVYATDEANNTGRSGVVYFSVDTTLPVVSVSSPKNMTYSESSVNLNFTLFEDVSRIGYSLDGGQTRTIDGNTTLSSLSDGTHNVVVYATDAKKLNTGNSSAVFFSVDTTPPTVVINSPLDNITYNTNNVSLTFKVSEESSLMYSLDGQSNLTLSGSIVFYNLTNGLHNVTIYSEDLYGNTNATELRTFIVDYEPPLESMEIIITSVIILVGFAFVIVLGYKNKS